MASTKGHGNPNWNRDETILALDLYLECNGVIPTTDDPRVVALSETLRSLPFHPIDKRKPSFRNADGVAFKLQNLRHVATGAGLDSTSRTDEEVWRDFGTNREAVRLITATIKQAVTVCAPLDPGDEYEAEFVEGRVVTLLHRQRERNPRIRSELLRSRAKRGPLRCDICDQSSPPGPLRDSIFEGHHRLGLSRIGEHATKLADIALVCANCHRALHRAITHHKRWIDIEEARDLIGKTLLRHASESNQPNVAG